MKLVLAAIISITLSQLLYQVHGEEGGFTYFETGGLGPNNWASLPIEKNQCGGMMGKSSFGQAPVTIDGPTANTCNTGMSQYSFIGGDCQWSDLKFTISSGSVKVEKLNEECSLGSMKIPQSSNKFNALQFHAHLFSEHQILGQGEQGHFPAELHVVHQEETEDSFAVFGTMISVGADDHPTFEWLLQGWEAAAQQVQDECVAGTSILDESTSIVEKFECPPIGSKTIFDGTSPSFPSGGPNVYELPTNPDFGVFTYKGGLTTPPCTEIVNWNFLDTPMMISESQLERLKSLILCYVAQHRNEDESLAACGFGTIATSTGSTSRPPQPLLGRRIIHRCPDGPDIIMEDIGVTEENAKESESSNNDDGDCVSGGMIALYVIIGIVLAFALFYVAHVQVVKRKLASWQKSLIEHIAKTVTIRGANSAEALTEEFQKVGREGNGTLDKNELRAFIGDKMDTRDFEVLFVSTERNGRVDSTEFSNFLAHAKITTKLVHESNGVKKQQDHDEKVFYT